MKDKKELQTTFGVLHKYQSGTTAQLRTAE